MSSHPNSDLYVPLRQTDWCSSHDTLHSLLSWVSAFAFLLHGLPPLSPFLSLPFFILKWSSDIPSPGSKLGPPPSHTYTFIPVYSGLSMTILCPFCYKIISLSMTPWFYTGLTWKLKSCRLLLENSSTCYKIVSQKWCWKNKLLCFFLPQPSFIHSSLITQN